MQQFEGFQFATTLDIKTGYYTIQLDTKPKDITNIVTEFGKFQYNFLPMGMVMSGYISRPKSTKALATLKE